MATKFDLEDWVVEALKKNGEKLGVKSAVAVDSAGVGPSQLLEMM